MDREIERLEAIQAGQKALASLQAAGDRLRSARNWGIYDILGGGFISSLIKHSRIDNARTYIEEAKRDLISFREELRDVDVHLDIEIGDLMTFFDLMDSFLADILVQSRIADAQRRIDEAIDKVICILGRLGA